MLLFLLIFFALYLFLIFPNLPKRDIKHLQGYDYAHRGLWNATLPENSMAAFRNAVAHGFGMELDVHLTKDDQLVVFHDDSLLRMCGVDKPICDCTLEELRRCRLKGTAEGIPTFDELLTMVNGQVPLIIEIKPDKRISELCQRVHARLQSYAGAYCIESFHPLAVQWFRKNAPHIIRGQLAHGLYGKPAKERTWLFRGLASLIQNVVGRPDFIAYEHSTDRNLPMILMRLLRPHLVCWTVRSQHDMNVLRHRYDLQIFEGFIPQKH
ncbi:MAG: glycerophosphodiester phosphodiesterase [Clostridia bacterium]|nr:glycerophosphodiester phosphodiesterase [Clostridia bacterium]